MMKNKVANLAAGGILAISIAQDLAANLRSTAFAGQSRSAIKTIADMQSKERGLSNAGILEEVEELKRQGFRTVHRKKIVDFSFICIDKGGIADVYIINEEKALFRCSERKQGKSGSI